MFTGKYYFDNDTLKFKVILDSASYERNNRLEELSNYKLRIFNAGLYSYYPNENFIKVYGGNGIVKYIKPTVLTIDSIRLDIYQNNPFSKQIILKRDGQARYVSKGVNDSYHLYIVSDEKYAQLFNRIVGFKELDASKYHTTQYSETNFNIYYGDKCFRMWSIYLSTEFYEFILAELNNLK